MDNNSIKKMIGKDYFGTTIVDAKYDKKTGNSTLFVSFYETYYENKRGPLLETNIKEKKKYFERDNDNNVIIHKLVFRDEFGLDCLVDGVEDTSAYDYFNKILIGYGVDSEENETILYNLIKYLEYKNIDKTNQYKIAFTVFSTTSIWLNLLSMINYEIDEKALDLKISEKLDDYVGRYLDKNPNYLKRIKKIANNAKAIIKNYNAKSETENKQKQ